MIISSIKKAQLLLLIKAYDHLYESLIALNHPTLIKLSDAWMKARSVYIGVVEGRIQNAKPSMLVKGLEQGLRDLNNILNSLPMDVKVEALNIYRELLNTELPNLVSQDDLLVKKIIARGKILNEKEYYLIRGIVDLLEREGSLEELKSFYSLIDKYEIKG